MTDLDEELLALAGSEEEEEEEEEEAIEGDAQAEEAVESRPPSPSLSPSSPPPAQPTPDPAGPTKGIARKKAKVRGGAARRASPADFEDDEESSAPQSPNSLGSGAMSESESDNEPVGRPVPSTESNAANNASNPFPIDGKFKSQKDKDELMSLPEARREQILSERAEELEKTNFSRALKERMQVQQAQDQLAGDKKKRKAGAAELEDGPRTSSRPKTKATENLENYKRQREQRHERLRHGGNNSNRRSPMPRRGSGDSSDGPQGGIDWDNEPRLNNSKSRHEPQASLRDFNRCRIGRTNFAKVCYTPGFEEALGGCFVRVSVGYDAKTRSNVYKVGQIKEFANGKPYVIEDEKGKPMYMDQNLIAAHGKAEREQRFVHCSDGSFTEAELDEYRRSLDKDGMALPKLSFINSKLDQINALINRSLSDTQITERLRRIGQLAVTNGDRDLKILAQDRETAIRQSDEASIARIDTAMADIERKRRMLFEYSQKQQESQAANVDPAQRAREERVAKIQEANRKAELEQSQKAREDARKRQEEKRAKLARNKAERDAKLKKEQEVKMKQASGEDFDDLFDDKDEDEEVEVPKVGPTVPVVTKNKKMTEEELMQALDFELDVDI